jgi:hypothetical protein
MACSNVAAVRSRFSTFRPIVFFLDRVS